MNRFEGTDEEIEGKVYRWQEVANDNNLSRSALSAKKTNKIKIPFRFKYTKFDITFEVNGFGFEN